MRHILIFIWILILPFNLLFGQVGYELIRSDQTRVIDGKKFFVHEVKKGQTLYSISKAYTIEMQAVIDANPEIRKGLKAGQILLIPAAEEVLPPELPPLEDSHQENNPEGDRLPEVTPVEDPLIGIGRDLPGQNPFSISSGYFTSHLPCQKSLESKKEVYNVALMMHFFLKEIDSIHAEAPSQQQIESYKSLRYIQFYEGFLLAVDSLKKRGMNLKLYVYDVDPTTAGTNAVLRKPEMAEMDLIIGMLFNRTFEIVASWARDHRIPIVSPISERESQVEGNPMVIKVMPSATSEGIAVAEYLSQYHPYSHTLLVHSWEPEVRKMGDQVYANCHALGLDVTTVNPDEVTRHLTRGVENVVVVISNQKSFSLNILSQLTADTMGYEYTVFGLPRWDQIEGMDYEYLQKARAHIVVPSWIDYNDPAVKRMVTLFRQTYKTDPDNLAFQGYNVAWYFLNALKEYGTAFTDCLREITIKPLHAVYKFRRMGGDGWENQHWDLFRYENYSMIPMY